ncbi:MAG: hypothetical protein Q8N58_02415 [bacterium]|nr:hypothetical protein [bacterium]
MIRLSNGHEFEYMVASGALAFDGKGWLHEQPLRWLGLLDPSLFTVVIKTLTRYPRKGNYLWYCPWRCIRLIPKGVVNAVGLTNPGIDWWCREIGPKINRKKINLVGSIFSEDNDISELLEMARLLNRLNLVALEINVSCPNTRSGLSKNVQSIVWACKSVRIESRFPLILKLSVVHDISSILPEIKGIVEAISINSVPWKVIFRDKEGPLQHLGGGGVSGKIAQPITWKFVKRIINETDIPVIGPSVWNFDDIQKLRDLGAKAISFGSIFLRYPWRSTQFVREDMKRNRIQE